MGNSTSGHVNSTPSHLFQDGPRHAAVSETRFLLRSKSVEGRRYRSINIIIVTLSSELRRSESPTAAVLTPSSTRLSYAGCIQLRAYAGSTHLVSNYRGMLCACRKPRAGRPVLTTQQKKKNRAHEIERYTHALSRYTHDISVNFALAPFLSLLYFFAAAFKEYIIEK